MFKKFKISDVFYKIDTPKIKAKANDFPTEYSEEYCVPLLTAGAENQGLNRYAKTSNCPMIINNAISVSANGANSGICFYQPHDFAVLQDAYAVKVNGREIDGVEEGLYLTGALNKAVRDNHDWVNKAGWNHIKDDSVELPVIENPNPDHEYTVDDIDWQYMRDRITELERDRITELDAYLQATGLNDYELTEDDKKILSLSAKRASDEDRTLEDNSEDEVRFGEFLLKDIAKLDNGNKFDKNKMTYRKPSVYFVSRTASNNGVSDFVDNNGTTPYKAGCITLAFGGSIGSCFVQYNPFYTGQNVGVIDFGENVSFEAKQYIALCLGKYCKTVFTAFADEINKHFKKDLTISLPIKSDGTPDFDYMERYIRAMEKVVIADVVKYKNKVIETTKKVVGE